MTAGCALGPTQASRGCDREPVHAPGGIQGHGVLLVVDARGAVVQAAGDVDGLLGHGWRAILNKPLGGLFTPGCREDLADLLGGAGRRPSGVRRLTPAARQDLGLAATAYRSGGQTIVELEDQALAPCPGASRLQQFCCEAQEELSGHGAFDGLSRSIVRLVRELTGFDRVMLYKFHHDFSGEVVGEDRQERLLPFLGHRYPASDIPEPARKLYLTNWLRLICDVDREQQPFHPEMSPASGDPLDLTHSRLRAVSPMHVEYLRNMGVSSSLSLSVLVEGRLWGLLACHHHQGPRFFSWEVQRALTLVAQCFSMNLSVFLAREVYESRLAREQLVAGLQGRIRGTAPLERLVRRIARPLMDLVDAQGLALVGQGAPALMGRTPGDEAVRSIAGWLDTALQGDVHAAHCLAKVFPGAEAWKKTASGVLALRLGVDHGVRILWFRPEMEVREVWGGNPDKPYTLDPETGTVNPRKSFEAFTRTVRGVSLPWSEHDVYALNSLIPIFSTHIIRITESVVRQNERNLRQKNILLKKLTSTDPLTGVVNRRFLFERLDRELNRARRYGHVFSIAMLDIDRFKSVNDSYGHQAGDRLLKAVGATLLAEARETDVVGRYGGEEFLVLMPETSLEGAVVLAERIRGAIERLRVRGIEQVATASFGVAVHAGGSVLDLIDCADSRLYAAKKSGRNRVVYS